MLRPRPEWNRWVGMLPVPQRALPAQALHLNLKCRILPSRSTHLLRRQLQGSHMDCPHTTNSHLMGQAMRHLHLVVRLTAFQEALEDLHLP